MTGQPAVTANVLLLRFVDFRFMDLAAAYGFRQRLLKAQREEVMRAYVQLMEQTGGVIAHPWVTDIAVILMDKLGIEYQINRVNLTTGEETNVRQNRQVDSGAGREKQDDLPVRVPAEA